MFTKNSPKWNRKKYPKNWEKLARVCKDRANWHCERCNAAQGEMRISKAGKPYPVRLAACHANHWESTKCRNPTLICFCQRCHAWYDAPYKARKAAIEHERRMHKILLNQQRRNKTCSA